MHKTIIRTASGMRAVAGALTVAMVLVAGSARAADPVELVAEENGNEVRLPVREPTDQRIAGLKLPAGFRVARFADDLGAPRMLRVGADGTVYATRPSKGDVIALRDEDGDGRAERRWTFAEIDDVHDLALRGNEAFFVSVRSVYRSPVAEGRASAPAKILDELPEGGRHPNRTIAFAPDGKLLVSIGSTCNACVEPEPEAATIIRLAEDGSGRRVFASGLRNTIGFGWHPKTKAMWGMDHGSDWLGDEFPPEELNLLEEGKFYGWPFVSGGKIPEQLQLPKGLDAAAYLARTTPAVLGYRAHAAPMQLAFYDATSFPEAYRDDAFVAMHGSWNRKAPAGYEVVRIDFADGKPVAIEPFLTGFVIEDGGATFGRPVGIAIAKDGALLVSDDKTGVIYRITYGA